MHHRRIFIESRLHKHKFVWQRKRHGSLRLSCSCLSYRR